MTIMTSGRQVRVGFGHPSVTDIAIGMSRMPRFAGHTKVWWSVLDHSLFCESLVVGTAARTGVPTVGGDDEEAVRLWRIAMLLHDAHEALTGDVPTPFKTDDFRAIQESLDQRIMNAFFPGGARQYAELADGVKLLDRRALLAEAFELLPHDKAEIMRLFGPPSEYDVTSLAEHFQTSYGGVPPKQNRQESHPGVQEYQRRLLNLL